MLEECYVDKYLSGDSMKEISRQSGISTYRVKRLLLENGVAIRSQREQLVMENVKRGQHFNTKYFKEYTKDSCYLLGFIGADGNVAKRDNRIKITLASVDREMLERIAVELKMEKRPRDYMVQGKYPSSELSFYNKEMKQDLIANSIVPNKTYIGISMKTIPDEFKINFIHGFFDGDGSVSMQRNGTVSVKMISHKREILEEIQDHLKSEYEIKSNLLFYEKKNYHSLEISTTPALKFMDLLIEKRGELFLMRKYKRMLEIKEYKATKSPQLSSN